MAKLQDGSRVYGSLYVNGGIGSGAGTGFASMAVLSTVATGATYSLPPGIQFPGAKFKVTIIGGGGQGGGAAASSSGNGAGGGSGAVVVALITVVSNLYTFTYTVGAAGSGSGTNTTGTSGGSSSIVYNGITYTAGGGAGGPPATSLTYGAGGTASVSSGTALLFNGGNGGPGGIRVSYGPVIGYGGSTPLGYGQGGEPYYQFVTSDFRIGSGYGAGGAGCFNTGASALAGSAGTQGLIIVEY